MPTLFLIELCFFFFIFSRGMQFCLRPPNRRLDRSLATASRASTCYIALHPCHRLLHSLGGDSSVGIAEGCRQEDGGSFPGWGKRLRSISQRPDRLWRPPSLVSNVKRYPLSIGLKRPWLEADNFTFTSI